MAPVKTKVPFHCPRQLRWKWWRFFSCCASAVHVLELWKIMKTMCSWWLVHSLSTLLLFLQTEAIQMLVPQMGVSCCRKMFVKESKVVHAQSFIQWKEKIRIQREASKGSFTERNLRKITFVNVTIHVYFKNKHIFVGTPSGRTPTIDSTTGPP